MIQVTAPTVETKFTFFEMEVKVLAPNAATFRQPRLGRAPEAVDAIDVAAAAADEDAVAMFNAKMFPIAEVDQAVVAELAAGAAATFPADPAPPEVRLIDLDDAAHGGMGFAFTRHADTKRVEEAINGSTTNVGELRHFRGLEVEREEAHDLAKLGLRNM